MEVTQPAIVLANRQGVASLVCNYKHIGNAKEIRVTLLKQTGDKFTEICASTYTTEFKMFSVEEVIQCHVSPSRNNVTLTLTGLQANDTGLYVCKMERMYPPPYFMNKGNGTQLYVIGKPSSFPVLGYSQLTNVPVCLKDLQSAVCRKWVWTLIQALRIMLLFHQCLPVDT